VLEVPGVGGNEFCFITESIVIRLINPLNISTEKSRPLSRRNAHNRVLTKNLDVSARAQTADRTTEFQKRLDEFRPYLMLLAQIQVGRRLQGKIDAEDLVQETMLAAVAKSGSFRGSSECELTAWLRKILLSRVLKNVDRFFGTAARDVRRELSFLLDSSSDALNALGLIPSDQSTPSKAVQRRERAVLVANTLSELPSDYREVLVFRNMEGLSFSEIAERMGRTVGAVTMLWTRAVRQFRLGFSTDV